MRKTIASILTAALLVPAAATARATPPKLLVVISVDQFSADLFDEYRSTFSGGLARISSGNSFRNGYQSHAATETCPGHSTILTGDHPARSGVIANHWIDQSIARSDKTVYCAEDERAVGSSSGNYRVSPRHLKVPTLGELIKARSPASRTVAVAGKDRAAVMMSGQRPDQRWYWNGEAYVTDLKGVTAPASVAAVNRAVAALIAAPGDALELPAYCRSRSKRVAVEGGGKPVGDGGFARAAGDAKAFRSSPAFDGATLALAAALVREMGLGKGPATDLIAIGASATDYVGHSFGTEGAEMCLQLASLDHDLGGLLAVLDARRIDYQVVLTADHGGNDIPERERQAGLATAARVDPAISPARVGKAIGARLGLSGPVLLGESAAGDIWLDASLKGAQRSAALAAAVAAYRASPQVAAVFTHDQLARTPMSRLAPDKYRLVDRARASFDAQRSGDLVVLLKPRITPIFDTHAYVATHGSAWDYDRRVPILFWRPGQASAPSNAPVETTDIMPTLAALIGLPIAPGSVDGHCLTAVAGQGCGRR